MNAFTLHRPSAIDAISTMMAASSDSKFLAGGMTLLPSMKLGLIAPNDLIDLTSLPAFGEISSKGRRLSVCWCDARSRGKRQAH